jgi:hypothetical protein
MRRVETKAARAPDGNTDGFPVGLDNETIRHIINMAPHSPDSMRIGGGSPLIRAAALG